MTSLYNCMIDGDNYRITKFDDLGNPESSYLVDHETCQCPAGHRPTCRHRQMLPLFLAREAVNTFYFYDFDRGGWVTNEPAALTEALEASVETAPQALRSEAGFDREMQRALEADGEKLFQLTGEDHGPVFLDEIEPTGSLIETGSQPRPSWRRL